MSLVYLDPALKATEMVQVERTIKLSYIDALRGWAIFGVVLVHALDYGAGVTYLSPLVVSFCQSGAPRGVQLFFIISTFTLFLSMRNRQSQEKRPTLNFFIRRFFRIAPLFYLGMAFYILTYSRAWATLPKVLVTLLFINGAHPNTINSLVPGGWSIAIEMSFYAVASLLFRWIKHLDAAVRFSLLSLLASMLLSYLLRRYPLINTATEAGAATWDDWLFGYFPSQLPIFALGMIFFFIAQAKRTLLRPSTLLVCSLSLLVGLAGILTVSGDAHRRQWLLLSNDTHAPSHWLFGVGFVLLALALQQRPYSFFVNPITIFLGRISFSLYLAHFAIFTCLNRLGALTLIPVTGSGSAFVSLVVRFFIGLTISAGVAHLLFRFIETPFQQVGKRLIVRLERNAKRPSTLSIPKKQEPLAV